MWIECNPNPVLNVTRDCAIRAVAISLDVSWDKAFVLLAVNAFIEGETMDSDTVSADVLRQHGFTKHLAPDCVGCYSIKQFCEEYPQGTYVLKTDNHVVAAIDGNYYDVWDSGDEPVLYYWSKED